MSERFGCQPWVVVPLIHMQQVAKHKQKVLDRSRGLDVFFQESINS